MMLLTYHVNILSQNERLVVARCCRGSTNDLPQAVCAATWELGVGVWGMVVITEEKVYHTRGVHDVGDCSHLCKERTEAKTN